MSQNNGNPTSLRLKTGLAEMLKGGVIMDVTTAEQAVIAEKSGAVAVMALERVPAQIRAEAGVARMASPKQTREIVPEMKTLTTLNEAERYAKAKRSQAPCQMIKTVATAGKLRVPNFAAGGIATPADASLVMQLGAEAVFVGSGIFMGNRTSCTHSLSNHPYDASCALAPLEEAERRARAIVKDATHFNDPKDIREGREHLN